MKIIPTPLPGCIIIEPAVFSDSRGIFYESWNAQRFAQAGLPSTFLQNNVSVSSKNVLRGLHYQWPRPQGKFVSVLEGEVYDVAVDIRPQSPHYKQHTAVILSGENKRHFWIPEGFAHGFVVLSDQAIFSYACTDVYVKEADAGIRWNDAECAIDWPVRNPIVSDKDAAAPFLKNIASDRLPEYSK